MGESQSRYSIVERLTTKKLELMNNRSNLKDSVNNKEQHIAKLKKDYENWKIDVQEDVKRESRKMEIEIERAVQDLAHIKNQLVSKEGVIAEQIKAIEEALRSIEEISKTSPTVQS